MRVLLVQPPIYDFTACDFWLRPYGLLRVAGRLRGTAELELFDFLTTSQERRFPESVLPKPPEFRDIPRRFRRFGVAREAFQTFLRERSFDVALVQTMMTYWYLGLREVVEDLRRFQPRAKVVLGGVYATLCPGHARGLGADLVVEGNDLRPLWSLLHVEPTDGPPFWEGSNGRLGIMKLTDGCPFRCTYCSVPTLEPKFAVRPTEACLEELRFLIRLGIREVALYDDALLFQSARGLVPFLEEVIREGLVVRFHTPNALNARFMTPDLARLMVRAGFKTFFLGFESGAYEWQRKTGGKVYSDEFVHAVRALQDAGAESVTAYLIVGHPDSDGQETEASLRFASAQGARVMLSEFAPIPGTPDGEKCRAWVDIAEPLHHNKTAFAIRRLGERRVNELKALCRTLNSRVTARSAATCR